MADEIKADWNKHSHDIVANLRRMREQAMKETGLAPEEPVVFLVSRSRFVDWKEYGWLNEDGTQTAAGLKKFGFEIRVEAVDGNVEDFR